MVLSDRNMLRLHIEAVWGIRLPPLVFNTVELLSESTRPSWKLYVAELSDARLHIWRPDVDATEREGLLAQVNAVFSLNSTGASSLTISHEVVLNQRASSTISPSTAQLLARTLTSYDSALVETFEPGSADYYLHADRSPCIGVIIEGRLLSVAHSSRRTAQVCELGIDTLPQARVAEDMHLQQQSCGLLL